MTQELVQHFKDQVKVLFFFYPKLSDFQKSIAFRKVRLRPFAFVVRGSVDEGEYGARVEWRWQEENRGTRRKNCPDVSL